MRGKIGAISFPFLTLKSLSSIYDSLVQELEEVIKGKILAKH